MAWRMLQDPDGERGHIPFGRHIGQDDEKFIAAEPAYRITIANVRLQVLRYRQEHRIANRVPQPFVDQLEAVEIEM